MNPSGKPLDPHSVVLSHPYDFIRHTRHTVRPGTCFVLMPFAADFQLVYDTIATALRGRMVCTRADDLTLGDAILERILRGISEAELIIADLTGQNPNVFYELAIAHTFKKDVMLLAQSMDDVPFDLRHFFCRTYNLRSKRGIKRLKRNVKRAADEVKARNLPSTIRSGIERTRLIVDHMSQLLDSKVRKKQLIRIQASLSSLGNIGAGSSSDEGEREYGYLLEQERELMLKLIRAGASVRAILSPRRPRKGFKEPKRRRKKRVGRVMNFLKKDLEDVERCEFSVTPAGGSNILMFNDEILFEGYKTRLERGFGCTMVYTDSDYLKVRCEVFDSLFESARAYTIAQYCEHKKSSEELRKGVIRALEKAI